MDELEGRRQRKDMDAAIDRLAYAHYDTQQRMLCEFIMLVQLAADRLEELGDDKVAPTLRDTLYEITGSTPEGIHGREDA